MVRALLIAVVLVACGAQTSEEISEPEALDCGEPAPASLVEAIHEGMTTDATMSRSYMTPATDLSGLPLFDLPQWADPVWIIGLLDGVPDGERVAIWLTNEREAGGLLLAVNYGARQNSEWGADVDAAIGGRGTENAEACFGLD